MQRRELLTGLGLAAAVTAIPNAAAQAPHHHHGTAAYQTLADKASDCVSKGELCLTHCYELLAQGDKSMASCAKSLREMLALCTGTSHVRKMSSMSSQRWLLTLNNGQELIVSKRQAHAVRDMLRW